VPSDRNICGCFRLFIYLKSQEIDWSETLNKLTFKNMTIEKERTRLYKNDPHQALRSCSCRISHIKSWQVSTLRICNGLCELSAHLQSNHKPFSNAFKALVRGHERNTLLAMAAGYPFPCKCAHLLCYYCIWHSQLRIYMSHEFMRDTFARVRSIMDGRAWWPWMLLQGHFKSYQLWQATSATGRIWLGDHQWGKKNRQVNLLAFISFSLPPVVSNSQSTITTPAASCSTTPDVSLCIIIIFELMGSTSFFAFFY
jgi:hypothetical protein